MYNVLQNIKILRSLSKLCKLLENNEVLFFLYGYGGTEKAFM